MAVPYQNHQKRIRQLAQQGKLQSNNKLDLLLNKPFWIWDKSEHLQKAIESDQHCCFNHIVGLPIKNNKEFPLFDYQKTIFDLLQSTDPNDIKDKHVWIKKGTGIGITEFMLRFMGWLCTKDDSCKDSQMVIVTGPNIDIAIKLIKRLKNIFYPKLGIIFDNKETVLELNSCTIQAFPSNHLDSFRSLTNPKFILLDEADFWRKSEQDDVRHVSERYIGKSDPYLVMVSTPNIPMGLMASIEKEPEGTCIYKRLKLDYRFGLNKIFTNHRYNIVTIGHSQLVQVHLVLEPFYPIVILCLLHYIYRSRVILHYLS